MDGHILLRWKYNISLSINGSLPTMRSKFISLPLVFVSRVCTYLIVRTVHESPSRSRSVSSLHYYA